ncbi:MAG TPA: uracil-DNA glycosylase [Anaerolineaceae bacterium]|jgi:uracil-DNA glycosylase family 4|nr:uracil-DNA glycosylase [Anaerolineaceae bacterium]
MPDKKDRLDSIREELRHCRQCALARGRRNVVPGEGPHHVQVMFIGEGPGRNEDQQGKPFVGQAGAVLDELLAAAGLKREEVFIANVIKCRPPNNRDPLPEEISACRHWLDEQINLLDPKIIVTLGRFSMARFIENARIGRIHGQAFEIEGRKVVTMYHPAASLHNPALKNTMLADFAKLGGIIKKLSPTPNSVPATVEVKSPPENTEEEPDAPVQLTLF